MLYTLKYNEKFGVYSICSSVQVWGVIIKNTYPIISIEAWKNRQSSTPILLALALSLADTVYIIKHGSALSVGENKGNPIADQEKREEEKVEKGERLGERGRARWRETGMG